MKWQSGIYVGWVRHRRYLPKQNSFRYPTFMMYLDLSELPKLFDKVPFWSARGRNVAEFRRSDYHGPPEVPLETSIRASVRERTGVAPTGPIRMLTHMRYFGHCFNPVTFYYCYDDSATRVETVVAEIENTPWGERHAYVLPAPDDQESSTLKFGFEKDFHVSPFQDMDLRYDWRFLEPSDRLAVHMKSFEDSKLSFDATLSLRREEISTSALLRKLARYPFLTLQVLAAIYGQAARLKLKGFRFYPHPSKRARELNPTKDAIHDHA